MIDQTHSLRTFQNQASSCCLCVCMQTQTIQEAVTTLSNKGISGTRRFKCGMWPNTVNPLSSLTLCGMYRTSQASYRRCSGMTARPPDDVHYQQSRALRRALSCKRHKHWVSFSYTSDDCFQGSHASEAIQVLCSNVANCSLVFCWSP